MARGAACSAVGGIHVAARWRWAGGPPGGAHRPGSGRTWERPPGQGPAGVGRYLVKSKVSYRGEAARRVHHTACPASPSKSRGRGKCRATSVPASF
jgi:hypothetical protein